MAVITPSTHITQIKQGSIITGNLKSSQSIRVDGNITGDLLSDEKIIIGINGEIGGNLRGIDITVEGFVNGDVMCKGLLHITKGAKIYGKIYALEMSIEKGAELNGKVNVGKDIDIPELNTSSPSRSSQEKPKNAASPQEEKNGKYGSVAW
ncbi:polymer-forming cytoskeletal protein [Roseivirga sp.]|uniref:bactofilin family protein n=1 Tax=Roseivirga sp. TaxID=1964215 RepID=UPI002B26606E|nr:polymer-forming cytoskeletal protein [Roseivirga sp.]